MKEKLFFTNTIVDFDIKEELKKELNGFKNILIISGKKAHSKIKHKLDLEGKKHIICYVKECSLNVINEILEHKDSFDLVLGIGGGKALDVAKYVAYELKTTLLTLPTIAATCAATSSLSVLYDDEGRFIRLAEFSDFYFKCLIDLETIKNAPKRYLVAGIGDTMAKFYEFNLQFNHSKQKPDYQNTLGNVVSVLCKQLNYDFSINALKQNELNEEFKNVVMAIIFNTGLVSRLINPEYNGALAHAVCYALSNFASVEKNFLHGELVAFGILVQLRIEKNHEEHKKLCELYEQICLPCKIDELIDKNEFLGKIDEAMNFILSSSDVINLINAGFKIEKEELKSALIY